MLQCVVPGHVVLFAVVCPCPTPVVGNMCSGMYFVWLARPSHLYTQGAEGEERSSGSSH